MAKAVESWRLFWLIALAASVATCAWLPLADFHSARGIAPMIQRSVRYALPLFLLAFTASSLAKLWPSQFTKWLLRNRRYIGLGFAFAMAWHLGFVGYSVFSFGLYASALSVKATALDLIALTLLVLLTLTSFRWFARRLTAANWRLLHKAGVYVIWFVTTYIYLGNVVLRGGDALHDVALTLLIAAWLLRVIAWAKRRGSDSIPASAPGGSPT